MNNPSLLCNWRTTFYKKGIDGLSRQRGTPLKMNKRKKTYKTVNSKLQVAQEALNIERLEKNLEAENRDLRIENKSLKELGKLLA